MRMSRIEAARAGENGVEVLNLELFAARLAGGFLRPADRASTYDAVNVALSSEPLSELAGVRDLPGMARAVATTLSGAWQETIPLGVLGKTSARVADLDRLDKKTRGSLPPGVLAPPELAAAAIARVELCSKLFESV